MNGMTSSIGVHRQSFSREAMTDALCLALIAAVLAAPFVSKLGFYSDDWLLLAEFQSDLARGEFGLHSVWKGFEPRPLQGLYLALLFLGFGLQPFGYHLVNGAVIAAAIPLFYLLLRRLSIERDCAFAAALILIVLPQLSTVRVWYAAFQVPLSMLLAFLSLHCQLAFVRTGRWFWAAAAALFAVASVAAYEIFAPFLVGLPVGLLLAHLRRKTSEHLVLRRGLLLMLSLVVLFGMAVLVKGFISPRGELPSLQMYAKGLERLVQPDYDWRTSSSLNIFAALEVHFWLPLVGAAKAARAVVTGEWGIYAAVAGLAVAAVAFWRLTRGEERAITPSAAERSLIFGVVAFLLGHAVFLLTPQMAFSPTGVANRVLVAASVGVALTFAAIAFYAAQLVPVRQRRFAFAAAIAFISLLGSWRTMEISSYWAEAREIQERAFRAAGADLAGLPPDAVIIVDGVCPYHGPAVILESWWDSSGWLSLALNRPVRADTSTNRMSIEAGGLRTTIYGEEGFYPFGPDLYIYDPLRHLVTPVPDVAAAKSYFTESLARKMDCRKSYPGHGELI